MRIFITTLAATTFLATSAFAQVPAQSGPQNPAVKPMMENNASRPVAGANSFTEGQAKSHIEAKGFTSVTGLKKDANGVWRGNAFKGGRNVAVSVDYQGNVN